MDHNMTEGREGQAIFRFALPLIGASVLQTTYSFADSVIVGNFVGEVAFGAIGLLASLIMLVNMFCTSLGSAVSIVVSQFYGAGKKEDVRECALTAQCFTVIVSLIIIAVCLLLSYPVVVMFLAPPENMQHYSMQYFMIYSVGLFFFFSYNVVYGILRAHGDSKGAMFFLLIAAVINIFLDLLFVIVFHMEVVGAALATVISQAGSAVAAYVYMVRHYRHLNLFARGNRMLSAEKVKTILKLWLPILSQTSVLSIGFIVLQRLVNTFGAASIEGYAAMQKVESFIHIIPSSLNTAMANFTGQNIGANKPERVRRGYRVTAVSVVLISAAIAAVMIAFDEPLLSVFHISPEGLKRGCEHLDLLVIFMLPQSVYTVTAGLLQGAGDAKITAVASFINLFIRVSSAYIMSLTFIGYRSLWYSLPLAWCTNCVINYCRYRSGKWEHKALVKAGSQ
ncbi:MAG: MATE family efflux transporter [Lachnospiraceae bacterium]|nr:MATE family efflux transporter [Lachnospiraceae bacterium]